MESPIATRSPSREASTPEALERLEAETTELWGDLIAATYRFLVLVAELDRNEAYARTAARRGSATTVTDDGVFVFTRPDGARIPESGCAAMICGVGGFRGIVAAEGFRRIVERLNPHSDAKTSRCKWLGERMDYSASIEAMQFREINAATAVAPS